MNRYKSEGVLHYSVEASVGHKLILSVDPGIAELYRSLVPKSARIKRPKFAPHISVIRKEAIPLLHLWGKKQGEVVVFEYEPRVYNDETYYWLRCWSHGLVSVRRELGLPDLSDLARAPDLFDSFHCTIGNTKSV